MLDTAREVPTPEGIELSLHLAGPVARALAWMVDLLIRGSAAALLSFPLGVIGEFGMGILLIVWFALEWLYPALCEAYWGGATPGKRAFGLYVLNDDGTPVRLPAALTRNLLRAVDFLPAFYGLGLVAMLGSVKFQRLGDVAAGTVVAYRESATQHAAIPRMTPIVPPAPLDLAEQRAILDFAARSTGLTTERAQEIAGMAPVHLTQAVDDATALQHLLALANHLIGRRA